MGVQVTLKDIQSGFLTAAQHTANNSLIEAALDKALDRTSNTNNAMLVPLDMGDNRLINLADGVNSTDAVTLAQLNGSITGASSGIIASQIETQLGSQAVANVFTFTGIVYTLGSNNLEVYRNGQRLERTEDYSETTTSSITLTFTPNDNDRFVFRTNTSTTNSTTITDAVTHTEDSTTYNLATYLQNRHVVNVKDFGAVGDGASDDTAAINAAISAAPAGSWIVGDPTATYNFGTITGDSAHITITKELHFDWRGAKLLCAGENDSAYLSTALFRFQDVKCSFKNYEFEDTAFLFAGPSRGVIPVVINSTAASTKGYEIGPCHIVKGQSILTVGSADPANYRASDIELVGPITADEVYYGLNLANNGDNVKGTYSAEAYNRLFFGYGCRNVNIDIFGGDSPNAASANLLISNYGTVETRDLKIRATFNELNGLIRILDDSGQSGGSGILRNIDLDLTVKSYGANLPSTSNAIIELGTFDTDWEDTSTTTMDDIRINFKSPEDRPNNPIVQQTSSPNYGKLYLDGITSNQVNDFTVVEGPSYVRKMSGKTLSTAITTATQTNPVQITSTAHGFETGDKVAIFDVVGMPQINDTLFTVTRVDANNFTLDGEDGTGYTAYTSGGTAHATLATDISLMLPRDDFGNWQLDMLLGIGKDTAFSGQNSALERQSVIGYATGGQISLVANAQNYQTKNGADTPSVEYLVDGDMLLYAAIKGYNTTSGNLTAKSMLARV